MENSGESKDFTADEAELFEAISHPLRIKILVALNEKPMGLAELAEAVGMDSQAQLSFHLGKLGQMVKMSPGGIYTLTGDGKEAIWSIKSIGDDKAGEFPMRHDGAEHSTEGVP